MSITQDLGVATAYGYAVSKGYTGTEEEFATLMASYATTALKAEGFAVGKQNGTDVASGSDYYHNNSKYYSEQSAASATEAAASVASLVTDKALSDTSTNAVQNKAIKTAMDGKADELISSEYTEDSGLYTFRAAPDLGNRMVDKLIGGTVAWNQLVQNGDFSNGLTAWGSVGTTLSASDNTLTMVPTASGGTRGAQTTVSCISNHKYYIRATIKANKAGDSTLRMIDNSDNYRNVKVKSILADTWTLLENVFSAVYDYTKLRIVPVASGEPLTTDIYNAQNVNLIDLTQMFGSTIADYIYSLETSTSGAGVAWFKRLFPKDYYVYNAGTLQSVQAGSHIVRGFNQWDEEWEVGSYDNTTGAPTSGTTTIRSKTDHYIPVVGGTTYYAKTASTAMVVLFYDANKNFISANTSVTNTTITVPDNACFIRFRMASNYGTTYNHDICINLSDTSKNGTYEPYVAHTYPLDSDLELRGMLKLDSSNELYYDGDVYTADGKVTRKYGIVDLGTINWEYNDTSYSYGFFDAGTNGKIPKAYGFNYICSKYVNANAHRSIMTEDKSVGIYNLTNGAQRLCIRDSSYTDAATFKTAMSGVYLVYELATPTTELASPFASPQISEKGGTEEYTYSGTADVMVPVGHTTKYTNELYSKLDKAPVSPTEDGDYLLRRINGQNFYTSMDPYQIKPTVSGAIASFPDGADGVPVKSLKIGIEPVQDLHGYDNPWPAGGGKNIFNIEKWLTDTNTSYTKTGDSYTINPDSSRPYLNPFYFSQSDVAVSMSIASLTDINSVNARFELVDANGDVINDVYVNSVTIKRENKNASGVRLNWKTRGSFTVVAPMIELGSSATAFSPYSNICPISGWTGTDLYASNANLLSENAWASGLASITVGDGINDILESIRYAHSYCIPAKDGLYVSIKSSDLSVLNWFTVNMYKGGKLSQRYTQSITTANTESTYTVPIAWGIEYARINIGSSSSTITVDPTKGEIMAVQGVTAQSYVPPVSGRIIPITWQTEAGTVYGGTVDVLTGTLISNIKYVLLNNPDAWEESASSSLDFQIKPSVVSFTDRKKYTTSFEGLWCSYVPVNSGAAQTARWSGANTNVFGIRSSTLTLNQIKADATAGNIAICYVLDSPTSYQLTPQQVNSLLGQNNIWADTGNTEVTYVADPKLYLDNKLSGD